MLFLSFKSILKLSKQLKNIFSNFSVFLLTLVLVSFLFLCIIYCMKVRLFASVSRFDSELRKHLPAHWLYPIIWSPNTQGTKGPSKQVYVSETHSCIASLLSVYTHFQMAISSQMMRKLKLIRLRDWRNICLGKARSRPRSFFQYQSHWL